MITFEREGTFVRTRIDTGTGISVIMSYDCGSNLYAILLRQQLQEKQQRKTEDFAKKNYDEGWSDKLKKQNKRTWHPSKM